jgi:hypothetical protein
LIADSRHYEYCGVLHIHSRHSDGSGTVRQIIKAARKAGLDYIIVTDHNTLQAMEDGAEGWYDGLLVLVGEEIGGRRGNHYLAFGISNTIKLRDHRRYTEVVERQGGIGFAAHPNGLDNRSFNLHLPPWSAWDDPHYTGLEIWSYMCDWAESVTRFNILYYYFHPEKIIHGPPLDVLQRWDRLCQIRRVVGIGGSDVHARHLFPFIFIKFLSYKRAFRGVRTHLLTPYPLSPDVDESKKLIYAALRSGHCFFAHDFLADSTGFSFRAFTDEVHKSTVLKFEKETHKFPPFERETHKFSPFEKETHKFPPFEKETHKFSPFEKETHKFSPFEKETHKFSPFEKETHKFSPFEKETHKLPPFSKGGQGGFIMGDEVGLTSAAELEVTSPVSACLRLIHNGRLVKEVAKARQLTWKASEPGIYRVEARYNDKPWVFTNPIYLT